MPRVEVGGIEIEFESLGDPRAEPIVFIMGLGAPLTRWRADLCQMLVSAGYRVIRFDNRDCGLSTRLDGAGAPDVQRVMQGGVAPPYTLSDMAQDTIGLLDALDVERAHIVGASMGGMIAQLLAADHPTRTASLTSIMSTSGNPALATARAEIMDRLTATPPDPKSQLGAFLDHQVRRAQLIASPGYPTEEGELREQIRLETLRGYNPAGAARQMAAIWASGDRRTKLRQITAPTVVLHGADDPLIPPEGGVDTAANIAGAELRIVPGMGHDLAPGLMPLFAKHIRAAARR
jgi:pimeloyl-ACP methyl ester carboxylesterase